MIGGGTSQYDTIGFDLKSLTAEALNVKGAPAAPTMVATVTDAAASANGIAASRTNATSGTVKISSGFNDGDVYSMDINGKSYSITADGSADGYDDTNIGLMQQMIDKINTANSGSSVTGVSAAYDTTNERINITYSAPVISGIDTSAGLSAYPPSGATTGITGADKTAAGKVTINGTEVTLKTVTTANYANTLVGWDTENKAIIDAASLGVTVDNTSNSGRLALSSNLSFSNVTTTATATTPTMTIAGSTITVGGTPSTGDVFTLKVDGKDVSITVADDGYADTVAGVTHQMIKAIEDLEVSGMTVTNTGTTNPSTITALAKNSSDATMSIPTESSDGSAVLSVRPATDTSGSGETYSMKIDGVDLSFDVFSDKASYDTTTAGGIAQALRDKINAAGIAGVVAVTNTAAAGIANYAKAGSDATLAASVSGGVIAVTGAANTSAGTTETLSFDIDGNTSLVFNVHTNKGIHDTTTDSGLATALAEHINAQKYAGITATASAGNVTIQKTTIAVTSSTSATDGVFTVTKGGALDVTSNAAARKSLDSVEAALTIITDARAGLGAVINRLDNAISNLTSVTVNTELSLSRIKDTDYAQEMSRMTTAQILEKATMAMMSQSNASKQDVLQLLQ
jgi:flagellin